jgi:hypothetical protein
MGLVHDAENHFLVRAVLLGELRPDRSILCVRGSTRGLVDDESVPTSVVVLQDQVSYLAMYKYLQKKRGRHTRSMMTQGLVDAESAACTVASYRWKKLELMVPPSVGVMSCHAKGIRKMLTPSLAKCWRESSATGR